MYQPTDLPGMWISRPTLAISMHFSHLRNMFLGTFEFECDILKII